MPDKNDEPWIKLEKVTKTIRATMQHRTRPLLSTSLDDPTARIDRMEEGLLAVEEVLRGMRKA